MFLGKTLPLIYILLFSFSPLSSSHKWSLRNSGRPLLPPRMALQHPTSLSQYDGLGEMDVPFYLLPPSSPPPEGNVSFWLGGEVLGLFGRGELTGIAVSIIPSFEFATPFVLRTFYQRLPPNYHLLILTSHENLRMKQELLSILLSDQDTFQKREKDSSSPFSLFFSPRLSLVAAPIFEDFNLWKYSCILLSPWFYSTMPKGCTSILVFQSDSILLRKDNGKSDLHPSRLYYLRDFEKFSFVGAPWPQFDGHDSCPMGGNGGFSLRNRKAMEDIFQHQKSYPKTKKGELCATEDLAINFLLAKNDKWKKKLPSVRQAFHFSMEEVIKENVNPVGIHKSWKFRKNNTNPDVQMMASLFSFSPIPHLSEWASSFLSSSPPPSSSSPASQPPASPLSKFMEICEKICDDNPIISRKGVAVKNQKIKTSKCPIMPLTN